MKVLQVIPYMHPDAGGPPVVVGELVRHLRREGHCCFIATTSLLSPGGAKELAYILNELAPVEILPPSRLMALLNPATRKSIFDRVADAEIVHLHTLWNPINVLVRHACKALSRPYVIMPHGMLDPYSLESGHLKKRLFLSLFEQSNLAGARQVIYTTPAEEQLALSGLSWLQRGRVIALGGDAPSDPDGAYAEEFLAAFPSASGRRCILFLGRIDFKKGLDRIVSALPSIRARVPDIMLIIAGNQQNSYAEEIRTRIDSLGLQHAVLWAGRLAGSLKWGAYSMSEIFLLPSRQENFAITVAEAMHMARPVIISDRVNTACHVSSASSGLILSEAACEHNLHEAVLTLLLDRELAEAMGERGRTYAGINLTWAKTAGEMLQCYREVLAGR